jgi:16S rRNA (cytidine1402-2'-O)-methyltransferase
VRAARRERLPVFSVPGASVYAAALAAAGQPPLPATLVGFLPPRGGPRRARIAEVAVNRWSLVFLLSPHRLQRELADLADGLGADRPATLLCELSKLHERAHYSTLGGLAASDEAMTPRGEYVIVVGPPASPDGSEVPSKEAVRAAYRNALADGHDRKDALRRTARHFGLRRRDVYQELIDD